MPREQLRCLKCRTSKAKCVPGRPPWPLEPCERCRKYNYTCSPRAYKHSQQGSVTMGEVEVSRTTDPSQDAGPSNMGTDPTMTLIPEDELAPTLNPFDFFATTVVTQSEIDEQTIQLTEELTCLRLLWQDLSHFEHLRSEYGFNRYDDLELHSVKLFYENFRSSYKSTIARAWHHYRLGATGLLTQITSAWQPFAKPDQTMKDLEDLMRAHETAGDPITAVVLQELLLSKHSPNAFSIEAAAASEHLLDLYDIFLNLVARVASRLDLDVNTCISITPILHRVVRLDHVHLFNAVLRRGTIFVLDYLGRNVVHVAAECNAAHVLKEFPVSLLKDNSVGLFPSSPLLLAVRSKNIMIIRYLLKVQARCQRDNKTASDLMTAAAGTGLADVVQLLLVEGNFCSMRKDTWNIALKLAAALGHLKIVRLLLIAGADMNDTETSLYSSSLAKTALCYAAEGGHLEVVRHLLNLKADVSARPGSSGMAPLHGAAENGHYNIARMLLQVGADVNVTCLVYPAGVKRRASALELASAEGHVRTLRLLVPSSSTTTTSQALNAAAKNGKLDALNALLESGADIEDLNRTGTTALLEAVSGGHLLVVLRLLLAKANVEASSRRRAFKKYRFCTPLHRAAGKGLVDIVQALVDAGGNTNAINTPGKDMEGLQEDPNDSQGQSDEDFDEYYQSDSGSDYDDMWSDDEFDATVTPLWLAAGRGHTQTVRVLISAGAKVNATPQGCISTALQAAAAAGHCSTLQVLLEADADVNAPAKDPEGKTALQGASHGGHIQIVHLLLSARASVNAAASECGATALQFAVARGQLEIIKLLLGASADVNARPLGRQRTPLQIAAWRADVEIVQTLLEAGAVVNALPAYLNGHTAFHLVNLGLMRGGHADIEFSDNPRYVGAALQAAASRANVEVVRPLLSANADPNLVPNHSSFIGPLQGAARCGDAEIVRLLLDAKADISGSMGGLTPIQYAIWRNYEDIFKQLITAGADVNALSEDLHEDLLEREFEGETALITGLCMGNFNMAKQLLSSGADINRRGMNKPSALERASQSFSAANVRLVDLLLNAQADVNACSGPHGQNSPLGAAASCGNIAITEKLLTANADINLGNPLAAAARYGFVDMVRLLLSKQADPNATKGNVYSAGRPALVSAAEWGHLEVVETLLAAGTKLDLIESALSRAARRGHVEVVQALLRKGPDPNAVHATDRSPLREAAASGHVEILRLLLVAGADPNASTSLHRSEDCTPIEAAVYCRRPDAIRLLLFADADMNPPPSAYYRKRTLFQLALYWGDTKVLRVLEDAKTSRSGNGLRKRERKRKKKAVELDETSSSE